MNRDRGSSFARIVAITGNTVTELTRLRVFYVLLIFALVLIGSSVFVARFSFQQEFQILKDVSLGAISIFTALLAIVATARLLPQELEDRTIYTILSKPVHRGEYLAGKLLGVLLLLAVSTAVMSAMFVAVLYFREQSALSETTRQMSGLPRAQIDEATATIRAAALNTNLLPGLIIIYLKSAVLAAVTLLISTFATSNIFTVVVSVSVYFIGHLQAIAREYWLQETGAGWGSRAFLALVALIFPDLQQFNLVDDVVAGAAIPAALFARTAFLGLFYVTIYFLVAWFVFQAKEL